MGTLVYNTGQK